MDGYFGHKWVDSSMIPTSDELHVDSDLWSPVKQIALRVTINRYLHVV